MSAIAGGVFLGLVAFVLIVLGLVTCVDGWTSNGDRCGWIGFVALIPGLGLAWWMF